MVLLVARRREPPATGADRALANLGSPSIRVWGRASLAALCCPVGVANLATRPPAFGHGRVYRARKSLTQTAGAGGDAAASRWTVAGVAGRPAKSCRVALVTREA